MFYLGCGAESQGGRSWVLPFLLGLPHPGRRRTSLISKRVWETGKGGKRKHKERAITKHLQSKLETLTNSTFSGGFYVRFFPFSLRRVSKFKIDSLVCGVHLHLNLFKINRYLYTLCCV